jgi:glycosyltransferase involved in cell wall biosynthesis
VLLKILVDGEFAASLLADQYRPDLAGFGDGCCAFFVDPFRLSREGDHIVHICRADDGAPLPGSPAIVAADEMTPPEESSPSVSGPPNPRAALVSDDVAPCPPLQGHLDLCDGFRLEGWAFDRVQPGWGVWLEIRVDGELIGHVVANRYRDDLASAGCFGDGCCSFATDMPVRLNPGADHVISVCRADDGASMPGSPIIVPAISRFDAKYLKNVAKILRDSLVTVEKATELDETIRFLGRQTETLLAARARLAGGTGVVTDPYDRWDGFAPAPSVRSAATAMRPQALFIDNAYPLTGSDGGSNALLDHMRSLMRLGFDVSFAASEDLADRSGAAAALSAIGINPIVAPWYGSLEEVLRRLGQPFDLVYLHRVQTAWTYQALVRRYCKRALVVYGVADLHHLRLARQAQVLEIPSYAIRARRVRMEEMAAAQLADIVITHSSVEADLLRQVPNVTVAVVPWSVSARRAATAFSERDGVAFIGGFGHDPNLDAVHYLAEKIAPLVRKADPSIRFHVVGRDTERLQLPTRPDFKLVGDVDDINSVFDAVRLTVAPLRFGAGLKSKVVESLAAGVPCIGTSIAYEGMAPPDVLRGCVADEPADFAAALLRLYREEQAYSDCSDAGRLYAQHEYSEARVDDLMRKIVAPILQRLRRATQMQADEPAEYRSGHTLPAN